MSFPADAFTGIVHPAVRDYLEDLPAPEDPLVARLESYGADRGFPLVGRESGRVLELLTTAIGGRRVFEFGSGYGFSAFYFARAVGEGGEVLGSEKDAHEISAHHKLFGGHPLAARIHIQLGSALPVFCSTQGLFDAIFLDLDKESYPEILDAAIPRLRPGGLLFADNVLWGGKTTREPARGDNATTALRHFNALVFSDPRLMASILPVGDGLMVALRRR